VAGTTASCFFLNSRIYFFLYITLPNRIWRKSLLHVNFVRFILDDNFNRPVV